MTSIKFECNPAEIDLNKVWTDRAKSKKKQLSKLCSLKERVQDDELRETLCEILLKLYCGLTPRYGYDDDDLDFMAKNQMRLLKLVIECTDILINTQFSPSWLDEPLDHGWNVSLKLGEEDSYYCLMNGFIWREVNYDRKSIIIVYMSEEESMKYVDDIRMIRSNWK